MSTRSGWDWRSEMGGFKVETGGWIDDPLAGMTIRMSTWRGTEQWRLSPDKEYTVLILRGWEKPGSQAPMHSDPTELAERIQEENAWADVELYLKVRIRRE